MVKVSIIKKDGTLRVIIPKEVREELKIKAGDSLLVSYDKSGKITYRRTQSL